MLKNKVIKLVHQAPKVYDPIAQEYKGGLETFKLVKANVTDAGSEQTFKEFGEYIQKVKIVRLSLLREFNFEYIEMDEKRYKVLKVIRPLNRCSIYVQEVSNG